MKSRHARDVHSLEEETRAVYVLSSRAANLTPRDHSNDTAVHRDISIENRPLCLSLSLSTFPSRSPFDSQGETRAAASRRRTLFLILIAKTQRLCPHFASIRAYIPSRISSATEFSVQTRGQTTASGRRGESWCSKISRPSLCALLRVSSSPRI